MLVVFVWMTWDDYHRSWKGYQKRFFHLDAQKTKADIEQAQQAIDQKSLQDLTAQLEEGRKTAEQHKSEQAEAEKALHAVQNDIYRDDLTYRKTKSTFDAVKFDYEEAAHDSSSHAAAIRKRMDELAAQMESYRVKLLEHDKRKAESEAALKKVTGAADEAQKKIEGLETSVARLQKKLKTVEPTGIMKPAIALLNAPLLDFVAPTIKIQQVVLERSPIDINFTRIPRADRCQTCHLAAD